MEPATKFQLDRQYSTPVQPPESTFPSCVITQIFLPLENVAFASFEWTADHMFIHACSLFETMP
jgi:hypothetical protein